MGDVRDFYRVFMVPGMTHCSGGAGVDAFGNGGAANSGPLIDADHDLLKALELWVEGRVAPRKIIATHYLNNVAAQGVRLKRPLCPWPERGEYRDPNSADSFRCVHHHDGFDTRNIGPQVANDGDDDHDHGRDDDD